MERGEWGVAWKVEYLRLRSAYCVLRDAFHLLEFRVTCLRHALSLLLAFNGLS